VPPALSNVTVENYDRLLEAMRSWTGIPDLSGGPDNDSYQTQVAYVDDRDDPEHQRELGRACSAAQRKEVGVTCYTCHRGQPVPNG
jgi:photosynthetic reaction center cytochrome c subunit